MPEYSVGGQEHAHHVASPISVTWVVLASLICALGLVLLFWGALMESWPYFIAGPFCVFVGMVMLLNRRAGLDHA
jgi:hypothetical protein